MDVGIECCSCIDLTFHCCLRLLTVPVSARPPPLRFDVRWQPCADWSRLGVPEGSVEVFLESNILINAQSGTEEPLSEPVKHMVVGADGALLKIVNMDELVGYGQMTF